MKNENLFVDEYRNKYWTNDKGDFHRVDGPAIECVDGRKEWLIDDKRHRINGPALEDVDGTKQWWVNDRHHRLEGAAYEGADGRKEWWILNLDESLDISNINYFLDFLYEKRTY